MIIDIPKKELKNSPLEKECAHIKFNKDEFNYLYSDFYLDGKFFLPISKKSLMTSTEVFGVFNKKKYIHYFKNNYINNLESNINSMNTIENSFIVGSSENYFHTLIDYFPRLFTLNKTLLKYIDSIVFSKNIPKNNKMLEYLLEKMNLKKKIILIDNKSYLFKKSIYPLNLNYDKRLIFLKKIFKRKIDNSNLKNIFISRSDSQNRRIINENNLVKYLKKFNFKTYVLGKLNFIDQIKLFEEAKIIVSMHGAGLANLVFTNPEAKVVEIFPSLDFNKKIDWFEHSEKKYQRNPNFSRDYFKSICLINNIEHYFYFSSILNTPSFDKLEREGKMTNIDLTINIDLFSNFFENNII